LSPASNAATAEIAAQPKFGRSNPQSEIPSISRNYLIVYEVESNEVIVHFVRHGARRRPWESE
jgi:plasmid stabilization system protein ParE